MADYKKDWRGRIIFKDVDAAHRFWLTGYTKGKKRGIQFARAQCRAKMRKERLLRSRKVGASA